MYCSFQLVFRGTREGAPALLFLPSVQVKNGHAWLMFSRMHRINTFSVSFGVQPWGDSVDFLAYVRSTYSAPNCICKPCTIHVCMAKPRPTPILLLQPTGSVPEVSSVAGLLVSLRNLGNRAHCRGREQSVRWCGFAVHDTPHGCGCRITDT